MKLPSSLPSSFSFPLPPFSSSSFSLPCFLPPSLLPSLIQLPLRSAVNSCLSRDTCVKNTMCAIIFPELFLNTISSDSSLLPFLIVLRSSLTHLFCFEISYFVCIWFKVTIPIHRSYHLIFKHILGNLNSNEYLESFYWGFIVFSTLYQVLREKRRK